MTFEDIHTQMELCQKEFAHCVRDRFGRAIEQDVFDPCSDILIHLRDASEQAERERNTIRAMMLELRSIIV